MMQLILVIRGKYPQVDSERLILPKENIIIDHVSVGCAAPAYQGKLWYLPDYPSAKDFI